MEINLKKCVLVTTLGISSFIYANNTSLKFSPTDVQVFQETHKCVDCNLISSGGYRLLAPFNNFENSDLSGSNLTDSYISSVAGASNDWYSSNFDSATMVGSHFYGEFDDSTFKNTNLQEAHMSNVKYFNYVKFIDTDLRNADLSNSQFNSSDFTGAKMDGANLYGANLCHAIITEEQINSSKNHACAIKPDCSGRYPYPDGRACL